MEGHDGCWGQEGLPAWGLVLPKAAAGSSFPCQRSSFGKGPPTSEPRPSVNNSLKDETNRKGCPCANQSQHQDKHDTVYLAGSKDTAQPHPEGEDGCDTTQLIPAGAQSSHLLYTRRAEQLVTVPRYM